MAKNWTEDAMLVDSITGNLFEALPLLPKRLVRVDAITRKFDMPFSHIQIMCMLSDRSMTIGEISRSLGIAKPNITPLLDSLSDRGVLERVRSDKDRRIVYVRLLPQGRELAEKLQGCIETQVLDWPKGFNHSDIKRLNNALAYLVEMGAQLAESERSENQ